MNIRINGKNADIQLETEKTVGEILAGLEQWLANSGHRLSGLSIDGETIHTGSLEASFERDINTIGTIDIITSSLPELCAESLLNIMRDITDYEGLGFEEKRRFGEQWKESPQARFLAEQLPELFDMTTKTFSGEGLSPAALQPIIEERLRELRDPAGELGKAEPLIVETCARLEELPLDIQTGKDSRAAQTIQIFSGVAEKIFRLFKVLKAGGFPAGEIQAAGGIAPLNGAAPLNGTVTLADYLAEFDAALKELLAAYEQRDAVLVGDLAEYELAPRLRELYAAIKAPIVSA